MASKMRSLLNLIPRSADPTSPTEGDAWYNSTLGRVRARVGGSLTKSVAFTDDATLPFAIQPQVGKWVFGPGVGTYQAAALTLDRMYLVPFPIARTTTFDRLAWNCTAAGTAASLSYAGHYLNDATTMTPGVLGANWDNFPAGTVGAAAGPLSLTLTGPALYWVALTAGSGSAAPTVAATAGGSPYVNGIGGTTGPGNASFGCYYATLSRTATTLPSTAPVIVGTNDLCPRVYLRVAS